MNDARKCKKRLPGDDPAGTWLTLEVEADALKHNIQEMRRLVAPSVRLMAVVKSEAYGHGLLLASRAFLAGGADVLGVHSWAEAHRLREAGVAAPLLILGPVHVDDVVVASNAGVEITVASVPALQWAATAGKEVRVHLKVETGVNRQGVTEEEIPTVRRYFRDHPHLRLVGLASHFADIEDTTDHAFARRQMERFRAHRVALSDVLASDALEHMSCSAATLLWPEIHGGMARVGVSAYGIWPSRETLVSFRESGRGPVELRPAMTWKVGVSQVRKVPAGETVGYGRSWKAMTDSRVAVLPVGYSDGIPRALGGRGHVLIGGYRAPLIGRICMNLCMADVSNIPDVPTAGDSAVFLGSQGDETITPEMLAGYLGTIPYEILTLPGPTWRRVAV